MTPAERRRMGRRDFAPNTDPLEVSPYQKDAWGYDLYISDYLDGWYEAEDEYLKRKKEEMEGDKR